MAKQKKQFKKKLYALDTILEKLRDFDKHVYLSLEVDLHNNDSLRELLEMFKLKIEWREWVPEALLKFFEENKKTQHIRNLDDLKSYCCSEEFTTFTLEVFNKHPNVHVTNALLDVGRYFIVRKSDWYSYNRNAPEVSPRAFSLERNNQNDRFIKNTLYPFGFK